MFKHINALKSFIIFQIALTQLADRHLGTIDISGRFKKASFDSSGSIKILTVRGEISHLQSGITNFLQWLLCTSEFCQPA